MPSHPTLARVSETQRVICGQKATERVRMRDNAIHSSSVPMSFAVVVGDSGETNSTAVVIYGCDLRHILRRCAKSRARFSIVIQSLLIGWLLCTVREPHVLGNSIDSVHVPYQVYRLDMVQVLQKTHTCLGPPIWEPQRCLGHSIWELQGCVVAI